ncbi:MAG: JAB domain-containing protein [Eubacteriales bacterium]|nr:JAB domain-containing protein [Eubacteriales bacterium]
MSNEHKGHRSRMKNRYLQNGFDNFEEHEILEMLLYYCYPQKDTNPIAHRLLENFGSISAVLDAPVDVLVESGLTENSATFLKMLPDVARVYLDDKYNNKNKIIDINNLGDYFLNKFVGRVNEHLILLLLDAKCRELYCGVVSVGSNVSSDVNMRKIVDLAMRYNARTAVIAHNHPSGMALPSQNDYRATEVLAETLSVVSINLYDHIIIADNDYVSFRESGAL